MAVVVFDLSAEIAGPQHVYGDKVAKITVFDANQVRFEVEWTYNLKEGEVIPAGIRVEGSNQFRSRIFSELADLEEGNSWDDLLGVVRKLADEFGFQFTVDRPNA